MGRNSIARVLALGIALAGCAHRGPGGDPFTTTAPPQGTLSEPSAKDRAAQPPPAAPAAPARPPVQAAPTTEPLPITDAERATWPAYGDSVAVDTPAEPTSKANPIYPDSAREARVQGLLRIAALVRVDGSVGRTLVIQEIPALNGAATEAVARWRFKPAMAHGQPVPTWVVVPVKFSIH